jgi:hypothetical protein
MRKFELEDGEVELLREAADGDRGRLRLSGFVVLTDRRVVLLVAKKAPRISPWFGWLGFLVWRGLQQVAPLELMAEIQRDDFEAVHHEHGEMLSFHSKGEGYAHVSFVAYSMTPFTEWYLHMRDWAAPDQRAIQPPASTRSPS